MRPGAAAGGAVIAAPACRNWGPGLLSPPPQVQVHQPEGGNEAGRALLHPWGRCSWVLLQDASKERLKFR